MLVISKYGLEARRFDSSSNNWEDSEIRQWLNGEFYNRAFTEQEKKLINGSSFFENVFWGVVDKVFLLSKAEAEKYFANDDARRCKATDYAKNNGAYVVGNVYSWWWLRSPYFFSDCNVFSVYNGGVISRSYHVSRNYLLVRPALCINL